MTNAISQRSVDFFCVGAQKSGTTALHHYLGRHPDIFLPAIKETHFFDDGHGEWKDGISAYMAKYFGNAPRSRLIGEVDPEYLFFPEVPARLADAFPGAKLIFIFREPVSRAYSHYWMTVRRGREQLSFVDALAAEEGRLANGGHLEQSAFSYFSRGLYYTQVCRYLKHFPREQMLFLLSDDLNVSPKETLGIVYSFLGLPSPIFEPISDDEAHRAYMPISMSVQRILNSTSIAKVIGRNLLPTTVRRSIRRVIQRGNRRPFEPPALEPSLHAELTSRYVAESRALLTLCGRTPPTWPMQGAGDSRKKLA